MKVQRLLDRMAISASLLCMVHCLMTPLLLVILPALSLTLLVEEEFHKILLVFVLPTSLIALFVGCRRHKDCIVLALGSLGLMALIFLAYRGHDLLGETGEKITTVISGVILAIGHLRNYRLCRCDECHA